MVYSVLDNTITICFRSMTNILLKCRNTLENSMPTTHPTKKPLISLKGQTCTLSKHRSYILT